MTDLFNKKHKLINKHLLGTFCELGWTLSVRNSRGELHNLTLFREISTSQNLNIFAEAQRH